MLSTTPQIRISLIENIKILRTALSKLEDVSIYIPSDPASALIHILMKNPPEELEQEEKLLQDVVDEALAQGVLITRAARLRGQENEMTPTLKIMVSAAFTKKEMEKASSVLKSAITKCLGSKYGGSMYGRAMELIR
jgi:serine palmitoyltransferase